jgi:hypothetical protein
VDRSLKQGWYSYREASHRVGRSVRTLWRWRAQGMPMLWGVREGQAVRVVQEDVLLAWFRARLTADPIHQQRMRRTFADERVDA